MVTLFVAVCIAAHKVSWVVPTFIVRIITYQKLIAILRRSGAMACPETVSISWHIVVGGSCDYRSRSVSSKPGGESICVVVNIENFFELEDRVNDV